MKVDFCPVLCIPKVAILQAFWGISRFVWCRKMTDIISVQILGLQLGFSDYYLPRLKSIPMTRKAVVLDIRIILVNSVLHAKQKGFAEQAVHTNPLTNAACALNAPYIVLTL